MTHKMSSVRNLAKNPTLRVKGAEDLIPYKTDQLTRHDQAWANYI